MPKNWSDVQGEWQKKTLTHAESAFIEASNTGKPCRLFHQRKIPPLEAPTEKYSINAQLISDAILCSREDDQRDTRSFTIEGADIIGNINLSEHEIDSNLTLINCFIYGDILLNGSRLKSIYLASCHFRGISALHLTIARDTHIMRCTSTRSLKFNHTKSNGNFHLQNLIIEKKLNRRLIIYNLLLVNISFRNDFYPFSLFYQIINPVKHQVVHVIPLLHLDLVINHL